MLKITKNGIEGSYNLSDMLYEDMIWLLDQTKRKANEFEKLAEKIELDQNTWNYFWKKVRDYRAEAEVIEIVINDKDKMVTQEEFEVVKQILGSPIDTVSNCCGEPVIYGDICSDCKEHCSKVYIF